MPLQKHVCFQFQQGSSVRVGSSQVSCMSPAWLSAEAMTTSCTQYLEVASRPHSYLWPHLGPIRTRASSLLCASLSCLVLPQMRGHWLWLQTAVPHSPPGRQCPSAGPGHVQM